MIEKIKVDKETLRKYGSIINLPHHQSKMFPKMSMHDRAAQFSPFAALTGHEQTIKETARFTESFVDLGEEEKKILNEKMLILLDELNGNPIIEITHFIPDAKKKGGKYTITKGYIKKYDEYNRVLYMSDNSVINLSLIADINSEIFSNYDI
jgi:hypothetical protein